MKVQLTNIQNRKNGYKEKVESIENNDNVRNHHEVLEKLLEKIPKDIQFRKLAGLEENKNLTSRHYIVYSIKVIIQIAKESYWNICQFNGAVFLFNGCYWTKIADEKIKWFLGESAKRMGWDESFSDHFKYREHLLKQFKSEAHFPNPEKKDNRVLINLKNGTLEISKEGAKLRNFNPNDFLTYQLPFEYSPQATAPRFKKYLKEVLADRILRKVLAEFAGYIFIPSGALKLEKVLLLYGSGANGKSVFFDIIRTLVGKENISAFSLANLTDDRGGL